MEMFVTFLNFITGYLMTAADFTLHLSFHFLDKESPFGTPGLNLSPLNMRFRCNSVDSPPGLSVPFLIVLNGIKTMDYEI